MFMYIKSQKPTGRRYTALLCCALALLLCLSACTATTETEGMTLSSALSDGQATAEPEALASLLENATEAVTTSAKAYILMEASTGAVLAQRNPDARLPMASTTKIMTALVVAEALPLSEQVVIPPEAVGIEGSSVYLIAGEILTVEELLFALLLESANDAAVALACAVSGSPEEFAERMNRRAADMGLSDTHFRNPHGLDADDHYTTARELALISRAALENKTIRTIVSTQKKTIRLHGDEGVRLLVNHNRLLRAYDGCIGLKTGYTKKTGRCLVSAAERDGVRLIAVTLGAPDDWQDHENLLDYGFSRCEAVELVQPEVEHLPVWVISGEREYTIVSPAASVRVVLPRERGRVRRVVELPRFAYAPLSEGETMGQLVYYMEKDGQLLRIASVPLTATYGIQAVTYEESLLDRLKALFELGNH